MRPLALLALLAVLAACGPPPWPGQSLVGYPGLREEVRRVYERDATERSYSCLRPRLLGIYRAEIVERDGDLMTVQVRYAWRDEVSDDDPPFVGCQGTGERAFVVDVSGEVARVVGMSGEQRLPPRG